MSPEAGSITARPTARVDIPFRKSIVQGKSEEGAIFAGKAESDHGMLAGKSEAAGIARAERDRLEPTTRAVHAAKFTSARV